MQSQQVGKLAPTEEFLRVDALPWFDWHAHVTHNAGYLRLSNALKTPYGQMTLRPIQAAALTYLHDYGGAFCPMPVGMGKAQPDDEPVLLERGWTPIGQVRRGDRIFGSDGYLSNVIEVFPQGVRPVFELRFTDGSVTRSDIDHLWTFKDARNGDKLTTKTLREWLQGTLYRWAPGRAYKIRHFGVPIVEPLQWVSQSLPLDPYTLGVLIGDGGMSTPGAVSLTSPDADIVSRLRLPFPVEARPKRYQNAGKATEYALTAGGLGNKTNPLLNILRELGLQGGRAEHKFIPEIYSRSSVDQRLELLRGLFDTDGYVENSRAGYCTVSPHLARDVRELVEGLGGVCSVSRKENEHQGAYILLALLPRNMVPFWCPRKRLPYQEKSAKRQRDPFRKLDTVEFVGNMPCTCIAVDAPDHLYVTRNHILTHNTLVTFLAPRVVNAQRPVLFVHAELREKTWRDFQMLYRHWFGSTVFMKRKDFNECVFSYQELSRENGQARLFAYRPDLICADEAQALKNRNAACTRVVEQFMHTYHDTKFVALTGTPTMRSPMDFWHIMFWCLRHHMPMPRIEREAELWASTVRETKELMSNRPDASIFQKWLTPEERTAALTSSTLYGQLESSARIARKAFGKRFASAPGVVVSPDASAEVSAKLCLRRLDWHPGETAMRWIATLKSTKMTPNGVELQLPMDLWRVERQLASGFWYRWEPAPPDWWLEPRKAYGWYLRNIVLRDGMFYSQYAHMDLISPARLANAIVQGRVTDEKVCKAYQAWIDVRDSYTYEKVAEWIDDGVLKSAANWIANEGGIVWTEHRAFGQRLAQMCGTGFCSADGLDAQGVLIDDYQGRPVVASVKSNHKGRNLQAWNKNLGVTFPPNGAIMEQLIGRTHRPLQYADIVYFDWVNACEAQHAGFIQLLADARYIEDSTTQKQKLNYAEKR